MDLSIDQITKSYYSILNFQKHKWTSKQLNMYLFHFSSVTKKNYLMCLPAWLKPQNNPDWIKRLNMKRKNGLGLFWVSLVIIQRFDKSLKSNRNYLM